MKYDDASWHDGGDFPQDLPQEAGATHIALFLAWAASSKLLGELHTQEEPELLARLLDRSVSPASWFVAACDGKFTDEDLTDVGNAFAMDYYGDPEAADPAERRYLNDYCATFAEFKDVYRVPDDWQSYERLKPLLDKRFADWKSSKSPGWRRFFQ